MEPKIPWHNLDDGFLIDIPEVPGKEKIEPGSRSQEKKNRNFSDQSVLPTFYFSRNMIPDSPAEPDQMEMVPYSEPLNIPLEDMSGHTALIFNYVNDVWPEPKGEQPLTPDFPLGMNNMMLPQPQFPGYDNNQMDCGMAPENMMGMGPPTNNIFIPRNQIMMNNQMYKGDQLPQQSQPLPLQQQQHHRVPVQENQWMGPPGLPMQHDQHQPYNNKGPPPNFKSVGGGRGYTRWDNPRGDTNDKMKPKIPWQCLDDRFLIDIPKEPGKETIEPGSRSEEKKKQTCLDRLVQPTHYFSRNMIPDSPAEPDQMEMVQYSEPLNIIPLENMSRNTALIYNYVNREWPQPKGEQPPAPDFPLGLNNMMLPQTQFPGYDNNQMNWGMAPENMMGMGPPTNNIFFPPNQIMMNNQMYMGDQLPQQSQPLPLQQQSTPQQHHQVPVQEDQWMGPPRPPMQHDQHWGQHQPPNNNGPPSHFERGGGGRGHTRWDNPRGGNYDSYRGKINRNNQRGNRGGPYNCRGGHLGNGRAGRLCKYYSKQGFCNNSNCVFLHTNG